MLGDTLRWLLDCSEPWTRYRTLLDLADRPERDADVQSARREMLDHPQVQTLVAKAASWPGYALKRHNDAKHPLHALSTLADFGLHHDDPGMATAVQAILTHQSVEGAFQTLMNISTRFGGSGEDTWTWMLCDAPTLLYSLLSMALGDDAQVCRAVAHLASLVDDNGWRCLGGQEIGTFRGPGRKTDPCPIANVYALKALALVPDLLDSQVTRRGVDMILGHWQERRERKMYLFGIGTDFRKLKYPYIWYDILHVVEVLSRFPFARSDPRLREMIEAVTNQADSHGRYTASSMYRAWSGWSFADKKAPSPWLTFLVLRILRRMEA